VPICAGPLLVAAVVLLRPSDPERVQLAVPTAPAAEPCSVHRAAGKGGLRVCSCCCAHLTARPKHPSQPPQLRTRPPRPIVGTYLPYGSPGTATINSGSPCHLGCGCTLRVWQWSPPSGSEVSHYRPTINHHIFFAHHLNHHIDDRVSGLFIADDNVRRRRIHDTAAWVVDVRQ